MTMLLLLGVVVGIVTAMRPMVGIVLAANAFLAGALDSGAPSGESLAGIVLPMCCIAVVAVRMLPGRRWSRYIVKAPDLVVALFALLTFVSALYSPFPDVTLAYATKLLMGCIAFYFLAKAARTLYADDEDYNRDFVLGAFSAALIFAIVALGTMSSSSVYVMRLTVGDVSSIPLAMTLGLGLIAGANMMLAKRVAWFRFVVMLVCVGGIGVAFALANTRSVMLGLVAAAAIAFATSLSRLTVMNAIRIGLLGVLAFGALGWIVLYHFEMIERSVEGFARIGGAAGFGVSELERINAWRAAGAVVLDAPFFGEGGGVFQWKYGMYPHNAFLETGSGMGLAGVLVLVSFLVLTLGRAWRVARWNSVFLLAAFTFLFVVAQVSLAIWMNKLLFMVAGAVAAQTGTRRYRATTYGKDLA